MSFESGASTAMRIDSRVRSAIIVVDEPGEIDLAG